jgi:hypothetical protein
VEGRRLSRDARLEAVIAGFAETPWEAQLCQLHNPVRIRSMVFEEGGRVTVVTARSRSRNAYHLAVLIAHFLIIKTREGKLNSIPGDLANEELSGTASLNIA